MSERSCHGATSRAELAESPIEAYTGFEELFRGTPNSCWVWYLMKFFIELASLDNLLTRRAILFSFLRIFRDFDKNIVALVDA